MKHCIQVGYVGFSVWNNQSVNNNERFTVIINFVPLKPQEICPGFDLFAKRKFKGLIYLIESFASQMLMLNDATSFFRLSFVALVS